MFSAGPVGTDISVNSIDILLRELRHGTRNNSNTKIDTCTLVHCSQMPSGPQHTACENSLAAMQKSLDRHPPNQRDLAVDARINGAFHDGAVRGSTRRTCSKRSLFGPTRLHRCPARHRGLGCDSWPGRAALVSGSLADQSVHLGQFNASRTYGRRVRHLCAVAIGFSVCAQKSVINTGDEQ